MRYLLTISPRAPRRHAGYLAGVLLLTLSVIVVIVAGMIADVATHTAAAGLVSLAGLL